MIFYFLMVFLEVIIYFIFNLVNLYVLEKVCNKKVLLKFFCNFSVFGKLLVVMNFIYVLLINIGILFGICFKKLNNLLCEK